MPDPFGCGPAPSRSRRAVGGVWHLLVRANLLATEMTASADEAMPDPDPQRGRGQALPRIAIDVVAIDRSDSAIRGDARPLRLRPRPVTIESRHRRGLASPRPRKPVGYRDDGIR